MSYPFCMPISIFLFSAWNDSTYGLGEKFEKDNTKWIRGHQHSKGHLGFMFFFSCFFINSFCGHLTLIGSQRLFYYLIPTYTQVTNISVPYKHDKKPSHEAEDFSLCKWSLQDFPASELSDSLWSWEINDWSLQWKKMGNWKPLEHWGINLIVSLKKNSCN